MNKIKEFNISEKFTTFLFYLSILIFLIAFNFQDSKTGGWYQQWLPNTNGRAISDITFIDSLVGFAVTPNAIINDTGYILKTTNGGDNWIINSIYPQYHGFNRVKFLNSNTGYVAGSGLLKTTNSGLNWTTILTPNSVPCSDISLINVDTFYICNTVAFDGGLFITRNGGSSWTKLYYSTNSNPSRIYMYNERIGFMMTNDNQTLKTTNGGNNWFQSIAEPYTDIHFVDSLTGWKANGFIKKTTDGGINWISQNLPNVIGGIYTLNRISKFSFTMRDTIWGTLGYVDFPNGQERGIIYKTTNSGINWGYQIPDTSIVIYQYDFNCFTNKLNGWAYSKYNNRGGIHTTVGGDSTIYTGINNNITFLSKEFLLYQNYPNPFNSITNVKVQMLKQGFAEIKVFDLTGRLIKVLLKQKINSGEHNIKFNASDFPSGVYFYSLFVDGIRVDTKKMLMIK